MFWCVCVVRSNVVIQRGQVFALQVLAQRWDSGMVYHDVTESQPSGSVKRSCSEQVDMTPDMTDLSPGPRSLCIASWMSSY